MNRTAREKLVISLIAAFLLATTVLFFVWYNSHYEPHPGRTPPGAVPPG